MGAGFASVHHHAQRLPGDLNSDPYVCMASIYQSTHHPSTFSNLLNIQVKCYILSLDNFSFKKYLMHTLLEGP